MNFLRRLLVTTQVVLAIRMIVRLVRSANGTRIRHHSTTADIDSVSVLVPVLNERLRLAPCLDGLAAQGKDVREVLVIDGGSTDGTQALVETATRQDHRIRLIDASPLPTNVNGKAWGLQKGYEAINPATTWILTIDADVRPASDLVSSMRAHALQERVSALSAATAQRLSGPAEALVHPSMLTTLVYRFGIPGHATTDPAMVQANGQCFLIRRDLLDARDGFEDLMGSVCEDITLARALATAGHPVGFYETEGLVSVEMYASWRDAWTNWTRSLPMRDRYSTVMGAIGLAEILFLQALPLWLAPIAIAKRGRNDPLAIVNAVLLIIRVGMLQGMARAYDQRPWTYWLTPVSDLPVAIKIISMAGHHQHTWRGRTFTTGDSR